MTASADTHHTAPDPRRAVLNQGQPLLPRNLFEADRPLQEALARAGSTHGTERARSAGAIAGSLEMAEHGRRAERHPPVLQPYDQLGRRIDDVELDPSWHWLLRTAVERGAAGAAWRDPDPAAHAVRAAVFMLLGNGNGGVMCPVSMTYAVVPALRDGAPALARRWEDRLTDTAYHRCAIAGMSMTERQGGSDVRANITRAEPVGDGRFELWGHKWFTSYPPCDLFLVLAQTARGLSCFAVERGPGMEFQRLKDKLGTRSLPSSEVEFHGIAGELVGEEGRGVSAIIRMVNHTRLDCLLGSTAAVRRATAEAFLHASTRSAFGRRLVDQPLMRNVLADLALESEAATALAMRVAQSFDADEPAFRRFATAVAKYHVCKRAPGHVGEALECFGGNGYVEDGTLAQLYRDVPLYSIWEGSGNVAALDVLRAIAREPEGVVAYLDECRLAPGANAALDAHLAQLDVALGALATPGDDPAGHLDAVQYGARRLVEDLGFALQASLLVRYAPPAVADAFCAARLAAGGRGQAYGTLPRGIGTDAILDRVLAA
ncbi:MAG: acyl-CoA dehydrogenase family protein [Patulibacter minatonensis]